MAAFKLVIEIWVDKVKVWAHLAPFMVSPNLIYRAIYTL